MKKYFLIIPVFILLYFFSGCSNSTEPGDPKVSVDKLEFGVKQYLDTSNTKFEFVVKDTFTQGETIYGRITTKDILKSDTRIFLTALRTNGDTSLVQTFVFRDTNTVHEFYSVGFGKNWSGGLYGKAYRVINWKRYLLDSCFFFIKTQ